MKNFYALIFLLPLLVFSQNKNENYDYFIQFNTAQFSKKVDVDSLFSHKLFKSFNKPNSDIKLKDFISLLDKSKNATIHGTFKDSIAYTQITLPILDEKKVVQLIQNKIDKDKKSEENKIVKKSGYSSYTPANDDFTLAWNKKVLIVYISFDTSPKNYGYNNPYDYKVEETVYEDYEEEYEEEAVEEIVIQSTDIEEETEEIVKMVEVEEEIYDDEEYDDEEYDDEEYAVEYDDSYYKKMQEDYEKRRQEALKIKLEKQSKEIASLFKKGFTMPSSTKTNNNADISAWIDYQALTGKISSWYALFGKMSSTAVPQSATHSIKGMTMDMFFENDKARVEQTVEYSEPLAAIMEKVIARKPNQAIYNYFPKTEPLGYFTYHMSTEEILKNYPAIIEQSFSSLPIEKEGVDIILDLVTTIVDEEATATLLDGDFSMFFHGLEKYNYTYKTVEYDEDYEEIEVEKTIEKTKPILSFIVTSTHPKMSEKLLKLGLKKNVLFLENGNYKIKGSNEFGEMFIIKEGDVLVFTNGINYLTKGTPSDFSKKVAKETNNYYFSGNFNIQSFMKSFLLTQDFGKDTAKALRIADQFKNVEMKSSNKLEGNKIKVEMNMNSNFSNKNIILQTLDLIDYMN